MEHSYQCILVAVDGSFESELAFEKGVNVALRNQARLVLAHVIDIRRLQDIIAYDPFAEDRLEDEATAVLSAYEAQARQKGVQDIKQVVKIGKPTDLLARDIPDSEQVDLIMVGATGLNTFERLLIGSTSEFLLRHAKVDLLVVRDTEKTL